MKSLFKNGTNELIYKTETDTVFENKLWLLKGKVVMGGHIGSLGLIYTHWASLAAQLVKNLAASQEIRVGSLGQEDILEKVMATHSSILVWRIPWTEEPDGLISMGSQRVGHDWATNTIHTTKYKTDNYQGPTVQHKELYSIFWDNLNGKRIWKTIDICICITESLCCTPETLPFIILIGVLFWTTTTIYILLKYSWLTMFQVPNKEIRFYKYTYLLFEIIFHHRLLQEIDYSPQCYTVDLCCLLHIYFLIRIKILKTKPPSKKPKTFPLCTVRKEKFPTSLSINRG